MKLFRANYSDVVEYYATKKLAIARVKDSGLEWSPRVHEVDIKTDKESILKLLNRSLKLEAKVVWQPPMPEEIETIDIAV